LLVAATSAETDLHPEYPVKVVFINTQEMTVVFSQYDRRRSARSTTRKNRALNCRKISTTWTWM